MAESHRLVAETCLAPPSVSTLLSSRATTTQLLRSPPAIMWLRPRTLIGVFRLVARPATDNRLFSTCNESQQWGLQNREKYYTDPEYRRRRIDQIIAAEQRRLQKEPNFRKRKAAYKRLWHLEHAREESVRRANRFIMWCYKKSWIRQNLPWKSHIPKMYEEKVEHYCTACKFVHKNGYRLWWQHMDQSTGHKQTNAGLGNPSATEQYLCSASYLKTGWENIIPRGFEDVTTLKELRARARELGINVDEKLQQENHVSEQDPPKTDTAPEPKT